MEFLFRSPAFRIEPLCRLGLLTAAIRPKERDEVFMLDVMFIVIGLAFLAGAMLYAVACDRL
jgi:hypothetical protein